MSIVNKKGQIGYIKGRIGNKKGLILNKKRLYIWNVNFYENLFFLYGDMEKDLKYRSVKALIDTGEITEFGQIFSIITLTKVAVDMGTHTSTISDLNDNAGKISLERIIKLSELFEVPPEKMLQLLINQYSKTKGKK